MAGTSGARPVVALHEQHQFGQGVHLICAGFHEAFQPLGEAASARAASRLHKASS